MEKHKNLSIFVPHEGCPNKCSFCDQNAISGTEAPPSAEDVTSLCEKFLPHSVQEGQYYEIAFFGGSFTAIEKNYMISLLNAAYPFVKRGRAKGIRCSTRPDAIDERTLAILKEYGVTAIELGAQSMQNDVLDMNLRGHSTEDVYKASALIKKYDISLGLQMMTGLYGQSDYYKRAMDTRRQFIEIHPDTVRIYPTLTLKGTLLEALYRRGMYNPPSLEKTVDLCAELVPMFEKENIRIIKLGLHSDIGMEKNLVAGPYHPAFRELVQGRVFLDRLIKDFKELDNGDYTIFVNSRVRSQVSGQKKSNLIRLKRMGYNVTINEDNTLAGDDYYILGDRQCI